MTEYGLDILPFSRARGVRGHRARSYGDSVECVRRAHRRAGVNLVATILIKRSLVAHPPPKLNPLA